MTALTLGMRAVSMIAVLFICLITLFGGSKVQADHAKAIEQSHYGSRMAEAGRILFNTAFSTPNAGTISCAQCHQAEHSFASPTVSNLNAYGNPSIYNASALVGLNNQIVFGMEYQDPSLVNQVERCFQFVMGVTPARLLFQLQNDEQLKAHFNSLFGRLSAGAAYQTVAYYLLNLDYSTSAYEQYLAGDNEALSKEAQAGFRLFMQHGCNHCHSGSELGGLTTAPILIENQQVWRKVPALRNIQFTAPYLHDGREASLTKTVQWMAQTYGYRELTETEADLITRFLSSHSSSISDLSGEVFRAPH